MASPLIRSPALLFLLWSAWLASPYVIFGTLSYCRWSDNADSFLALAQANDGGGGPGPGRWWNPLMAGGQDALSSLQLPELVRWLFIPLPGWLAYSLLMGCQRFLAGYFLYRLLREELALEPWAALYGGLTYALFAQDLIAGGVAQGYSVHDALALPGIPATLWALARMERQRGLPRWLGAAGLGALVALGSSFPFAIFFFVAFFGWFAVVNPRKGVGFWALLAVFCLGWLVAEALPIWASMLNAPLSQRAHWDITVDALGDELRFPKMAFRLLRDNALSVALLCLGLGFSRLRDRRLNVLGLVIAGILIYVASYHLLQRTVITRLGFLSGFQFSRVYYTIPFLCATAGAIALPSVLERGEIQFAWRKRLVATISMGMPVGLLAMVLVALQSIEIQKQVLRDMMAGENFSAFFRRPELLALAQNHRDDGPFRVATVCPGGTSLHPGMLWAYGLETADGELQIYPKRYHRFWGEVIRRVTNKDAFIHDYFLNYGCRIYLFWPEPIEREPSPARFSDLYDLELLSLANVRFLASSVPLDDDRLRLVASSGEDTSGRPGAYGERILKRLGLYLKGGHRARLFIYENREVIPRVSLVHRTRLFSEREQLLSALAEASRDELATTAFLLRDEANAIDLGETTGVNSAVQVNVMDPERIVVSVSAYRPGILMVTQNYSPFWKVRIDGVEGRVIPVDHTFQGVSIEAGKHEIELTYRPPYALY